MLRTLTLAIVAAALTVPTTTNASTPVAAALNPGDTGVCANWKSASRYMKDYCDQVWNGWFQGQEDASFHEQSLMPRMTEGKIMARDILIEQRDRYTQEATMNCIHVAVVPPNSICTIAATVYRYQLIAGLNRQIDRLNAAIGG